MRFDVAAALFICGAACLCTSGYFHSRWRQALHEESGVPYLFPNYLAPSRAWLETRLWVTLFRPAGSGPGEADRRRARRFLLTGVLLMILGLVVFPTS
jgi:hypothetical protein